MEKIRWNRIHTTTHILGDIIICLHHLAYCLGMYLHNRSTNHNINRGESNRWHYPPRVSHLSNPCCRRRRHLPPLAITLIHGPSARNASLKYSPIPNRTSSAYRNASFAPSKKIWRPPCQTLVMTELPRRMIGRICQPLSRKLPNIALRAITSWQHFGSATSSSPWVRPRYGRGV